MASPSDAAEILDRDFLEMRARILEVAAMRDRIDRAEGSVRCDPRMEKILQAIHRLADDEPGRAEQVQRLFSNAYDERWQSVYEMPPAR